MTLTIRLATRDDYEAAAAALQAAMPGLPVTADDLVEEDEEMLPPVKAERWVAEVAGQVVGLGCYYQQPTRYHPQKFLLDGWVHPDHQHSGVGAALYTHAMDVVLAHDPISVRANTRENLPHTIRFLEQRGFVEAKRVWESILDLANFDFAPYAGVVEQVQAQGTLLLTLQQWQAYPEWEERLYQLYNELLQDVPDIDPAVAVSLEQFRQNMTQHRRALPDAFLVAVHDGEPIGLSNLKSSSEADAVHIGLTGVRRAYRGRKIALAMKLQGMAWARDRGYQRVTTGNASTNQPMLAINDRLGFAKKPAWLIFRKEL